VRRVTLLAALLGACGPPPRFLDQPVVWRVADDRDIPEPAEREYWPMTYFAQVFFVRRFDRVLELRDPEPAANTNALDDVPDSTWFTNRIGARALSPEEAALGPAAGGHGPPALPLTVVAAKKGGGNPGFIARDAGGRRFLVKFDRKENPEMQTAAGVVVNRFFWALGYNVPADHVAFFRRDELVVPADKVAAIDAVLETAPLAPGGAYRAFASELLPGKPRGGWPAEGVREDDPNDRVPHEHRRELRGLRVFCAWLGHTDMKEDNTLDMYVEEDGRRFLRHYLVDFGEALGGHAAEKKRLEDGWEHAWDWELQTRAFFSFGLWRRPWETIQQTPWLSIGAFRAEGFDPRRWREAYPYFPFFEADAADRYWAAKLVMRFDDAVIGAIVAEGKLSEPAAARHLAAALAGRRDAIGRAYLDAVTPLDELSVAGDSVCMVDLAVRHRLAATGVVELGGRAFPVAADGRVCLPAPPPGEYTVWRLRVRRPDGARPYMWVHLRSGRVIGVVRGS
jgi:hypothetical protein